MRILAGVVGAIVGAIVGIVFGLFAATVIGGDNDLFVGFLTLCCVPLGLLVGATLGTLGSLRLLRHLRETVTIRRKSLLLAVNAIGLALVIAGMLWTISNRSRPPDQKLLANFERHEATFDELIEMLKADERLIRVDEDWTNPENPATIGVSPARIGTYRRLLKQARVPRGFQSEGFMDEVDFFYWLIGSAVSSDTIKGYAYRKHPPIETRSSLDRYRPNPKNTDDTIKVYRHIRGNWYLFYEYIPG